MIDTGSTAQRSKRSAKAMFRGGCAIAALIGSIGAMAPAHAQIDGRPGGMIVENIPHAPPATMIVENIPHVRAPGFAPVNTPFATTMTPGESVLATARYDNTQISFTPGAAEDLVTVTSSEAIIDWTTSTLGSVGSEVTFLGDGSNLRFSSDGSSFTVLNRISTGAIDSPVRFDGTVTSQISGVTGGNIWFYSAGGIVIGGTGSFDVGSLVLTTDNIDTSGGLLGTDGEIRFRGTADSSAAVVIESGALIDALNEDSYVALVAPRVVQGGDVTVNGSTAYVAAEQADLTINEGLFDIVVTMGTTDANGVVHTGTTTGPAEVPTPAGVGGTPPAVPDPHAIYLMAVAKNDAVTMLVSGNLGYTAAVGATQEDGEIILSGGYNVFSGGSSDAPAVVFADDPVNGNAVNVEFGSADLTLTNDMTGQTTGTIDLTFSGATFEAQQGLTLRSDEAIGLTLANGGLSVGGNLVLDVSATGATDLTPGSDGEDANGGTISLDIDNGGVLSAGNISLLANATAGLGTNSAGTATGGAIDISLSGTGAITTGIMLATAIAIDATDSSNLQPTIGGDSIGGTITLNASGGILTAAQLALDTSATAASSGSSSQTSNDAAAGTISANFTGGTHAIDFLTLQTRAQAATSFDATGNAQDGLAAGGSASLLVDGATLTIANSLRVDAQTNGQTSLASAGSTSLTVRNSATLDIGDSLDISTSASGGNLGVENQAGTIDILADGASLTFDDLSLDAFSQLGDFGGSNPADAAAGGSIAITSTGGGQIVGDGFATINVNANATTASDGATGRGGSIVFDANGGTIQIGGSSFVDASGVGNSNSDPADLANRGLGTGGTITYRVRNAGTMSFANVFANSDGSVQFDVEGGGAEPVGEGGLGFGGQVIFDLIDGTFTANTFNIGANGSGGPGGGDVIAVPALATPAPFELDYSARPAGFGPVGVTPFALPVDPAANGGNGTGGTVTFNLNGGTATVANLTVSANGFGGAGGTGDGDLGIGAGNGGNGIGGAATFNAINGSLTITGTLTVASNGTGGNGGFGDGADAGSGGNGLGGTATFDLDGSATIDSSIVLVATDGFGGDGGSAGQSFGGLDGGPGGDGGSGTGGDATFNNTAGTISFGTLTAQSIGTGGSGGDNFGISVGDAVDDGGAGGDGIGGNANINLNQDDLTSPSYTVEANGVGGVGGSGLDAGDGGNAFGGTAALNINNAQVQLDDPIVRAIATGGNGSFSDGIGGDGGDGGSATGGVARIEVSGANGSIPITFIILESDGTGGSGGDGGATAFGSGGTAGNGGSGGDATGGSSELVARTGGTMTIVNAGFVVSSTGTGGAGGTGGNIDMIGGGVAGDGGDGGNGTGGSPTLLAQGGTIAASDISLTGAGTGGDGGAGGTDLVVQIGADGNGGDGIGGNPVIEVQEGSPGIITLGATSMLANGTGGTGTLGGSSFGGRIDIIDTSTDPAGLITMDSLTASALTSSSGATSGFFMSANSGPISVAGDVTINVGGNAEFAFDGTGQMTAGGNMSVTSGASILVSHTNNGVPTDSLDIVGTFTAGAQADFNAMAGSRIASGDVTDIRAEGDASAADLTAFGRIDLSAGQNATLGNGAVTGGSLAVVRIDAGSDDDPTNPLYDPQYNAAITGTVSSTGNVRVFAGGNAIFRNGSTTSADNRVDVQTGDDIIVESGATVSAGLNPGTAPDPSDPFNDQAIVNLNAGGLSPSLLSPILTPISSIIVAGTLEATNTAVVLNADAIDGLGGAINASSISADVNNAPPNGVAQSDDTGLLSANCLEGNICLGTLGADNRVEIGQSGVPISATIEGGSVGADTILITTRRDLVIGTDGIVSTFDGPSGILFESTEGNVELRSVVISSDPLQISAANGSLLGTGILRSSNDIGITVAGDIFAAGIFAGRELTTVANIGGGLEGTYSVPGSIDVGTFSQGVGDANIDAGGNIAFGQVDVSAGNDIILLAPSGNVFLGATSGAANISIFGVNVEIGSIDADDLIDIGASADIFGSDAAAGGDIDLAAGGSIDLASLDAGGMIDAFGTDGFTVDTLYAGDDTTLRSTNGAIIVNTDISVTGDLVVSGGAILLNALGELAVTDARATNGDIDIITGDDLKVDQALSTGNIALTSTGGFVAAGNLRAGQASVSPASANAGGSQTPFGSVVGSPGAGDITISAATDAIITSDVVAANGLFISAGGLIDIQALATGIFVETSSADLDIGTSGQLGTSNLTQDILIVSAGANAMILGGPAVTGAFNIDASEFGRIHSGGDLTIFAAAINSGGPSLIVEDLTAQVATGAGGTQDGNIGTAGALSISTEGDIRVNGALALTGATTNTILEMMADQEIRVNANGGNIAVTDANGGLAGQLNLSAQTILAATDAAADDIAGASVVDADIRLANSDGIDRDDGFFQAGGITFTADSGVFIQNSVAGTDFDDRRGFVVGDGGITIASASTGNMIDIAVNGIQRQSNGTIVTGIAMIAQTTLSTGFSSASTINGCLIAAPTTCGAPPPPPDTPELPDDPVQDLVEEEIEEKPEVQQPTTPLIETVEINPNREGPLIDDPVTGSGNDDLWIRGPVSGGNDD